MSQKTYLDCDLFHIGDYMSKPFTFSPLKNSRHMSEEEIRHENMNVEEAKKNPEAFGVIYDRYFEGIFNFIFRRTDDENLAGDLTSQTFLKALQNLKKYEFKGLPFSAWLYRIAANEVNKHYYSKKRTRVFSLEEDRIKEIFEENEHQFSQSQIDLLIRVLNELPTETMEVVEMRFFEGKNFKEIAYILNIGESGAKMRLYRAIEKLRNNFNMNWEE